VIDAGEPMVAAVVPNEGVETMLVKCKVLRTVALLDICNESLVNVLNLEMALELLVFSSVNETVVGCLDVKVLVVNNVLLMMLR